MEIHLRCPEGQWVCQSIVCFCVCAQLEQSFHTKHFSKRLTETMMFFDVLVRRERWDACPPVRSDNTGIISEERTEKMIMIVGNKLGSCLPWWPIQYTPHYRAISYFELHHVIIYVRVGLYRCMCVKERFNTLMPKKRKKNRSCCK